jgi:hypothetical protein
MTFPWLHYQEMELSNIPVVLRERNTNLPSSPEDFLLHVRMSLHERVPNARNIVEQLHLALLRTIKRHSLKHDAYQDVWIENGYGDPLVRGSYDQ